VILYHHPQTKYGEAGESWSANDSSGHRLHNES
jgi:hypothetical protein